MTTTPALQPPFSAASNQDQSPAFDFLQNNDFIAPFFSTPQPAFLYFPQTPRLSGTFTIAPQALLATPSSSVSAFFPMQQTADSGSECQQQPHQQAKQTSLNQPTSPLPRGAWSSSGSSDTGSIIIKDVEEDEDDEEEGEGEEEEEGDDTAQPGDQLDHHNPRARRTSGR